MKVGGGIGKGDITLSYLSISYLITYPISFIYQRMYVHIMASSIFLFPKIIESLNLQKRKDKCNARDLRLAIIRITGATVEKTIIRLTGLMVDLGYIKSEDGFNTYFLYQNKEPFNFNELKPDAEAEADNVLDKLTTGSVEK